MFHHAPVLVLALAIGIETGQYYWVLGALLGIVLTLSTLLHFNYIGYSNAYQTNSTASDGHLNSTAM